MQQVALFRGLEEQVKRLQEEHLPDDTVWAVVRILKNERDPKGNYIWFDAYQLAEAIKERYPRLYSRLERFQGFDSVPQYISVLLSKREAVLPIESSWMSNYNMGELATNRCRKIYRFRRLPVEVIDVDGKKLHPTSVKKAISLVMSGKAIVINTNPFTIRRVKRTLS